MALSIQDVMICLELPLFAIMHSYAFPWTDYDDSRLSSRLLFPNAVRDVIGIKDVIQDFYHTFSGTTFTRKSYRRQRFLDDIWGDVLEDMDNDQLLNRPPVSYGGIPGRGPIHLDSDAESLEFSDEEDPEVELEYAQSRRLEFGDYHFPVVHSDPRFAHPPVVRDRIDIEAQNFIRRIDNESQEALAKQSG